ncbi:hypothetical protein SCHPADRAFT_633227 [Schizopora paradoxa]|uniref:Uncharacterized protein n=1 Tax=Schizopora paradoxa TaxID=27342 RepID=A0A0H2R8T2_9AGAM|nr:hypothetical protein SCHPADRAFT_633227 [Schizopora paradoxa]
MQRMWSTYLDSSMANAHGAPEAVSSARQLIIFLISLASPLLAKAFRCLELLKLSPLAVPVKMGTDFSARHFLFLFSSEY